ncbi:hypothetical protein DFH06DRAFT_1320672 [Mycena polygramma]|nr:hypothetical protein DFH06DRAFT_1320672 [Mycena polygramma]
MPTKPASPEGDTRLLCLARLITSFASNDDVLPFRSSYWQCLRSMASASSLAGLCCCPLTDGNECDAFGGSADLDTGLLKAMLTCHPAVSYRKLYLRVSQSLSVDFTRSPALYSLVAPTHCPALFAHPPPSFQPLPLAPDPLLLCAIPLAVVRSVAHGLVPAYSPSSAPSRPLSPRASFVALAVAAPQGYSPPLPSSLLPSRFRAPERSARGARSGALAAALLASVTPFSLALPSPSRPSPSQSRSPSRPFNLPSFSIPTRRPQYLLARCLRRFFMYCVYPTLEYIALSIPKNLPHD